MLIGVQNDRGWRSLTEVLEVPKLADDPRFATNVERVRHRAECDAALAAETAKWSTDELAERLAAAGVPAAQIKDVAAVVEHPQLQARDRWRTVATEHSRVPALLPPATFSDGEAAMGDVPALGQHTRALLAEAGLDADDLIARGIAR
jgi:formyl-CoA transferase